MKQAAIFFTFIALLFFSFAKFCSTRKSTQQAGSILIKDARFVMSSEHRQRYSDVMIFDWQVIFFTETYVLLIKT